MRSSIKRPDYIKYRPDSDASAETDGRWNAEDINDLKQDIALEEWQIKHAFFCKQSAFWFHFKFLAPTGAPILFLIIISGFGTFSQIFFIAYLAIWGGLYYLTGSLYYNMIFKITKTGFLIDSLKVYPKWRYLPQDPSKMMALGKPVAIICIILAILIDPMYLAGAGGAAFMAFQKNNYYIDDGEKAYYRAFKWDGKYKIVKVTICKKRYMIILQSDITYVAELLFCTPENFERIMSFIIDKYPDAEISEDPFDF